ncbi:hypothetical protein SUGI_0483580 [Cryptomeria japonica]|nr:hypothetical protein SUGI_0483580 [Cryptomeria japonica]
MEGKLLCAVAGDGEQQRGLSGLPLHYMEVIFKKLPLISICRSRLVCKEWNHILSSRYFLSSLPKQDPWLLIIGLLAFRETPLSSSLENSDLYIFNPLMRIHSRTKIDKNHSYIQIIHGRNGEPYLVTMLDEYNPKISFRIYHYCGDSWRIKFDFQEETEERGSCYYGEMVDCNGFLFFWTTRPEIIYGYSIEVDCIKPVRIPPLPRQLVEDERKGFQYIVAYGSSVLLVVPVISNCTDNMGEGMVIWELFQDDQDKLLWKWREFARMSSASLTPVLGGDSWFHMCVTVGDYLCFGIEEEDMRCDKVAAYNLKEGSWQFLPQCGGKTISEMLSFDPKLIFPQILL